jgi:hypothetical protein
MHQSRLSTLTSLLGVILSFTLVVQSIPDDIYRYQHNKLSNSDREPYISDLHLLNGKLRLRRDAIEEQNGESTKIQDTNDATKASTKSVSSVSTLSDETRSATSHKSQIIDAHTFRDLTDSTDSHFNDSWSDIVDKPDTIINSTFKNHLLRNQSWKLSEDSDIIGKDQNGGSDKEDHKYYIAEKVKLGQDHPYIDLDEMNRTNPSLVKEHPMLSRSYRRAATIPLKFSFPFYGHDVKNITIATGGFLYTGDYVHSWLAATQYIAPLMANFDTSSSPNSKIRYADNGTALIVEWLNVKIQNRMAPPSPTPNESSKDAYSSKNKEETYRFQVILHNSGDIVFAYKTIPMSINLLEDTEHPVKVGLSDAYIIDRTIFFVRRKTIYEYHRINKMKDEIDNGTAIWFKAQPTCNVKRTCEECVQLKCNWCQKVKRCSDGMDRMRQTWLMHRCDEKNAKNYHQCTTMVLDNETEDNSNESSDGGDLDHPGYYGDHHSWDSTSDVEKEKLSAKGHYQQATITTISIVALIALSVMVWFVYAYFFPHSWSGQLLIKYRPSRWQWRRGEPRYTAASIHM